MEIKRYPEWSYDTFYKILLGRNIKVKKKSEVDRGASYYSIEDYIPKKHGKT